MNARTHRALAVAGAIWVSFLPAAAETPPFLPTVPFSATVFAPGLDGPSGSAEVFHNAGVFRVEADMPQGGNLTVLLDIPRRTQTIYMDIQGQRIRTAMPWGQLGLAFLTGSQTGTLPVELGRTSWSANHAPTISWLTAA